MALRKRVQNDSQVSMQKVQLLSLEVMQAILMTKLRKYMGQRDRESLRHIYRLFRVTSLTTSYVLHSSDPVEVLSYFTLFVATWSSKPPPVKLAPSDDTIKIAVSMLSRHEIKEVSGSKRHLKREIADMCNQRKDKFVYDTRLPGSTESLINNNTLRSEVVEDIYKSLDIVLATISGEAVSNNIKLLLPLLYSLLCDIHTATLSDSRISLIATLSAVYPTLLAIIPSNDSDLLNSIIERAVDLNISLLDEKVTHDDRERIISLCYKNHNRYSSISKPVIDMSIKYE